MGFFEIFIFYNFLSWYLNEATKPIIIDKIDICGAPRTLANFRAAIRYDVLFEIIQERF